MQISDLIQEHEITYSVLQVIANLKEEHNYTKEDAATDLLHLLKKQALLEVNKIEFFNSDVILLDPPKGSFTLD